jgi:hypothetical protein
MTSILFFLCIFLLYIHLVDAMQHSLSTGAFGVLSSGAETRTKPALAASAIVLSRSSKATIGPDPLSVTKEKIWKGHHDNCQECQQGGSPVIVEFPVHLVAEQGKCSCAT